MSVKAWISSMILSAVVASASTVAVTNQLSKLDMSGQTIGMFNGVPAYSNGKNTGTGEGLLDYQCVAYPIRYDKQKNGVSYSPFYGKMHFAKQIFPLVRDDKITGYASFENGGAELPQAGDWLCFSNEADPSKDPDSDSLFGHVAMVMSLDSEKGLLKIIEQNWPPQDVAIRDIPISVVDGSYTVKNRYNERCQGWCRYVGGSASELSTPAVASQIVSRDMSVVLIIDQSTSMVGIDTPNIPENTRKLELAKSAASWFCKMLSSNQMIGVVSFCDVSTVVMPMTVVSQARQKIDQQLMSVTAKPYTNIGAGIDAALLLLKGQKNPQIILLSDGGNTNGDVSASLEAASELMVPIHTIGIGTNTDANALSNISLDTGGIYLPTGVEGTCSAYAKILAFCRRMTPIMSLSDALPASGKYEQTFELAVRSDVTVFVDWSDSIQAGQPTIIDPGGQAIKATRLDSPSGAYFEIAGLASGKYHVKLDATGSGEIRLIVAAGNNGPYGCLFGLSDQFSLSDQTWPKFRLAGADGWPINIDCDVSWFQTWNNKTEKVIVDADGNKFAAGQMIGKLVDDGSHGDCHAADRIYGLAASGLVMPGPYLVRIKLPNGQEVISSFWNQPASNNKWSGPNLGQLKSVLGI